MSEALARVEYDYRIDGPAIYVRRDRDVMVNFAEVEYKRIGHHEAPADDVQPLRLDNDTARALYETLADYFGGSGHDTRALRKDYDAERKRVDRLIDHLTATPTTVVVSPEPGVHILEADR